MNTTTLLTGLLTAITCSISKNIMRDPTILNENGISYEKDVILRWIEEHGTNPETGTPLTNRTTSPNTALRGLIDGMRAKGWFD